MRFYCSRFLIIYITKWRFCQPFATAEFLADTAIDIFNQVIRVILGLTERHLQHEFPLRSWLKPKCRKAQRNDFLRIYEVDNFSSIYRVTGETIRMPREYSYALARFNFTNHFGKKFSPGFLCAFRLGKFLQNFHIFSTRIFSQFKKLCLNRHYLMVIVLGGLSSVEKI